MKKSIAFLLLWASPLFAATYTHLNWAWVAPSPVSGVTVQGYNLYITTTACSANFSTSGQTPVNASLITATTYQSALTANESGCGYITAVSSMGVESAPSAGFPINTTAPNPPSGLTATPAP